MQLGGLYVETGLDLTRLEKDLKTGTETVAKGGDAMAARFKDSTAGPIAQAAADMARAYGEGTAVAITKIRELGTAAAGVFDDIERKAKTSLDNTLKDTGNWVSEHKVLLGTLAAVVAGIWAYKNQDTIKEYWDRAKTATAEGIEKLKSEYDHLGTAAEPVIRKALAAGFDAASEASARHAASLIPLAEQYDKISSYTGRSINDLQTMAQTAKYTGVAVDSLTGMLNKISDAQKGTSDEAKRAAAQFGVFGVALKNNDGTARSEVAVLTDLIHAEAKFGDGAKKVAAERAIFGEQLNKDTHSLLTHANTWDTVQKEIQRINGLMTQDEINLARQYKAQKDQEAAEAEIWAQKDQAVYLKRAAVLDQIARDLLSGQSTAGQALARGWDAYMDSFQAFAANYLAQHEYLAMGIKAAVENVGLPLVDWMQRQLDGAGSLSGSLVQLGGDLASDFMRAFGAWIASSDQEMADALRGNAFERLRWGVANAIAEGTVNLVREGKNQLEAFGNYLTDLMDLADKKFDELLQKQKDTWKTLREADYSYPDIVTSNSWDGYQPGEGTTSDSATASGAMAAQAQGDAAAYQSFWGSAIDYVAGKSDQFVAYIGQAGLADKFQAQADATRSVYDDLATRIEQRTDTMAENIGLSLGGVFESFRSSLATLAGIADTAIKIGDARTKMGDAWVQDSIDAVNRLKGGAVAPKVIPAKPTGSTGPTSADLQKFIGDIKNSALAEQFTLLGDSFGAKAQTNIKNYEHELAELQKKLEAYKGSDKSALEASGKYWIEYRKGIADARLELEKWKDAMSFWSDIDQKIAAITGDLDTGINAQLIKLQTESVATRQKLESMFASNDKVSWDGAVKAAGQAGADVVGIWAKADADMQANAQARDEALAAQSQYEVLAEQKIREDALGELATVDAGYWEKRRGWLEQSLGEVKQYCTNETAYEIYAAKQRSDLRRQEIEARLGYETSFLDTLKDVLADEFGLWKDELTRRQEAWLDMSKSMASGAKEMQSSLADSMAGSVTDWLFTTDRYKSAWADTMGAIEDMLKNTLKKLIQYALENYITVPILTQIVGSDAAGSITGSKTSGSSWLSDLIGGAKTASGSVADFSALGKSIGREAGTGLGDYFSGSASSGVTMFAGTENSMAKIFGDGIDMSKLGSTAWTSGATVPAAAMASTYGTAETAAMTGSSILGMLGTTLGVVGAVGGLVTLATSLFGEQKKEVKKTASGYSIGYSGGSVSASGVDFYSDGSTVSTGVADPAVVRKVSQAMEDAAKDIVESSKLLGFSTKDFVKSFSFPKANITGDQLDTLIANESNAMAFSALDQAGLRGAVEYVSKDGETYKEALDRLGASYQLVGGYTDAYGYSLGTLAGITQEQIDAIREVNNSVAEGTLPAMLTMASAMGASTDILSVLASTATDTSVALGTTDEQLSNFLKAKYADEVVKAVGGEDAFKNVMGNLVKNTLNSIDAYQSQATYYNKKSLESIADLGNTTVTVENFWASFDAAMKGGLTVDQFEAWADASNWVNNLDTIADAISDFYDSITKIGQALAQRNYKALGMDAASSASKQTSDAQWEMSDAIKAKYDAATLSSIAYTQELERQSSLQGILAEAQSALDDATGASKAATEFSTLTTKLNDLAEAARLLGASEEQLAQIRATGLAALAAYQDGLDAAAQQRMSALDARMATAMGQDAQASLISRYATAEKELADARTAGYGATENAMLQEVQAAELAKQAADGLKDVQEKIQSIKSSWADLTSREYAAQGDDTMSSWAAFKDEQSKELMTAYSSGMSQEYIDKLKTVQTDEQAKKWQDLQDAAWDKHLSDLNSTLSDLKDSLSDAVSKLSAAMDTFGTIMDAQLSDMQSLTSRAGSELSSLTSTLKDITTGADSPQSSEQKASSLSGQINTAYSTMLSAGNGSARIEAASTLSSLAADYLSALKASTGDQSQYLAGYISTVAKLNEAKSITGQQENYFQRMSNAMEAEQGIFKLILAELQKEDPSTAKISALLSVSEGMGGNIAAMYANQAGPETSWRQSVDSALKEAGYSDADITAALGGPTSTSSFLAQLTSFNSNTLPGYFQSIVTLLNNIKDVAAQTTTTAPVVTQPTTPTGKYTQDEINWATNVRSAMNFENYGGLNNWTTDQVVSNLATYANWATAYGVNATTGFSTPTSGERLYYYEKASSYNDAYNTTKTWLDMQSSIAAAYGAGDYAAHWLDAGYKENIAFPTSDSVLYKTVQYFLSKWNKNHDGDGSPLAQAQHIATALGLPFSNSAGTLESIARQHYDKYGITEGLARPYRYGGDAPEGTLALVGEEGPELGVIGSGGMHITPNGQTRNILGAAFADSTAELKAEIRSLKNEISRILVAQATYTKTQADILDEWRENGVPTTPLESK
uniref:Phage tail tape measure protein, TP901 family n=1 Tax=Desulfovibrio sp. U5L TaxID=596152 RepID=I2Q2M8_9BACT